MLSYSPCRFFREQGRIGPPVGNSRFDKLVQSLAVLVIDDNQYMRKVVRNILINIGVKKVHEAADGITGLEAIRMSAPDLVILDWEMPLLNGAELVRIVRSPGEFPIPDVPIIMLTGHVERWRVLEAARLGVNEFLKKPVSGKALLERIMVIAMRPRAMVRVGDYYGPEPRKLFYGPAHKLIAPVSAPTAAMAAALSVPASDEPAHHG
jgi:two-component system chemotaxis response regulator CheY